MLQDYSNSKIENYYLMNREKLLNGSNQTRAKIFQKKQAEIIEIELQKILDACKGDKHVSEWYHPPKYSYQSLTPNPDDDYLLSIFGDPKNSIITIHLSFLVSLKSLNQKGWHN
nr:13148_t:CDS:2 [Entrophospora candida]